MTTNQRMNRELPWRRVRHAIRLTAISGATVLFSSSVFAASGVPEREPGLWEIKLEQGSPLDLMRQSMQAALQQVPEAQRKQMEQMMAQSGVTLSQPSTIRECVTPEMAKAEFQPTIDDPNMKCSDVKWGPKGSEVTYAMSCKTPEGDWKVDGRLSDFSPKKYKSRMVMTGTMHGKPVNMEIAHDARWLSSDCQGVKPH